MLIGFQTDQMKSERLHCPQPTDVFNSGFLYVVLRNSPLFHVLSRSAEILVTLSNVCF